MLLSLSLLVFGRSANKGVLVVLWVKLCWQSVLHAWLLPLSLDCKLTATLFLLLAGSFVQPDGKAYQYGTMQQVRWPLARPPEPGETALQCKLQHRLLHAT